jgi:hypothetical protein
VASDQTKRHGRIWLSLEELRWVERLTAGILEGRVDILNDWALIGVDERRYEVVQRDLARAVHASETI